MINAENYDIWSTFKGYTIDQMIDELRKDFEDQAYDTVPSGADLVSVDANYAQVRFTEIFGPYGIGYGIDWQPEHMRLFEETRTKSSGGQYTIYCASLDYCTFWYMLSDGERALRIKFPVTGYHENMDRGASVKGARTSALKDGFMKMLFQVDSFMARKKSDKPKRKKGDVFSVDRSLKPVENPGEALVDLKKAKELFGGRAPTVKELYEKDRGYLKWVATQEKIGCADAAAAYILLTETGLPAGEKPQTEPQQPPDEKPKATPQPPQDRQASLIRFQTILNQARHTDMPIRDFRHDEKGESYTDKQLIFFADELSACLTVEQGKGYPKRPYKPYAMRMIFNESSAKKEAAKDELLESAGPQHIKEIQTKVKAVMGSGKIIPIRGKDIATGFIEFVTGRDIDSGYISMGDIETFVGLLEDQASSAQEIKWMIEYGDI